MKNSFANTGKSNRSVWVAVCVFEEIREG